MTSGTAILPEASDTRPGHTELGTISINDRVVEKMAARAAVEIPDAGAAASAVPGPLDGRRLGALGARQTSLTDLPKTSADVDGSRVDPGPVDQRALARVRPRRSATRSGSTSGAGSVN